MAEHVIVGPDGKEYDLTVPDGATPDQIKAAGQKAMQSIQAAKSPTFIDRAKQIGTHIANNVIDTGNFAQDFGTGITGALAKGGSTILQAAGSNYVPGVSGVLPQNVKDALTQQGERASQVAEERYDRAGTGAFFGAMLPELLGAGKAFTPARMGIEAAIKRAPQFLQKTIKPGAAPYAAAAVSEGGSSAFFNPDDPLYSAAISAGLGTAGMRLSRAIAHGAPRAADVDILTSEGVPLTVGQAADKRTYTGRVLKRFEEGLTKLPLVGDMIRLRQQEALDAARRAAVKRGDVPEAFLPKNTSQFGPIKPGAPVSTADMSIDQMIEKQAKEYAQVYGDAVRGKQINVDPKGFKNIQDIIDNPDLALLDTEREALTKMVGNRLLNTLKRPVTTTGGTTPKYWDAETLMKNQASFRKVGYKFAQSPDPVKRDMGFALRDIADEVYEIIGRQDAEAGKLLEKIRAPYSSHRTVAAASARAPKIGEFTMPQLAKQAGRSGNEWLETFARQGSEHLPLSIPTGDSSTSMLMSIIGAAVAPKLMVGAGTAGTTFGTKTGQKVLQGQTAWQQGLADQLRKIGVD